MFEQGSPEAPAVQQRGDAEDPGDDREVGVDFDPELEERERLVLLLTDEYPPFSLD